MIVRTMRTIGGRVLESPQALDLEWVCFDGHSSDSSREILIEPAAEASRVKVIAQPRNIDRGQSGRTAIEHMTGGPRPFFQDAALKYDAAQYPRVFSLTTWPF